MYLGPNVPDKAPLAVTAPIYQPSFTLWSRHNHIIYYSISHYSSGGPPRSDRGLSMSPGKCPPGRYFILPPVRRMFVVTEGHSAVTGSEIARHMHPYSYSLFLFPTTR